MYSSNNTLELITENAIAHFGEDKRNHVKRHETDSYKDLEELRELELNGPTLFFAKIIMADDDGNHLIDDTHNIACEHKLNFPCCAT